MTIPPLQKIDTLLPKSKNPAVKGWDDCDKRAHTSHPNLKLLFTLRTSFVPFRSLPFEDEIVLSEDLGLLFFYYRNFPCLI